MEFSPRGFQRNNNTPRRPSNTSVSNGGDSGDPMPNTPKKDSSIKTRVAQLKEGKLPNILGAILFVSLIVLIITIILGISSFNNREIRAVDKENYQAVVLADGQAYFGKITKFSSDYLILVDVYYVQGQQLGDDQSQPAASLRKLGCEIHGPQDHMIIYRNQVMYWENLTPDGRVPELIGQFKEQNPNGQTCSTQTQSGSQNNGQSGNGESSGDSNNGGAQGQADENETPTTPPTGNPDDTVSDIEP